jgi:mannosyltransferase
VPRYLLVVLAPTAILAAVATAGRLPVRKTGVAVRVVVVLAVLTFVAWPGQRAVRGATYKSGSDYRSAAGIIRRAERPGDGIIYTPDNRSLRAGIDYYLRSDPGRPRDVTERRPAAAVAGLIALEYPDAARRAAGLAGVWLFVYGDHRDPLSLRPDLAPLLRTGYRRIGVWHVNRATLALFRRPPS